MLFPAFPHQASDKLQPVAQRIRALRTSAFYLRIGSFRYELEYTYIAKQIGLQRNFRLQERSAAHLIG
jgi:hypothetical protein